MNDETKRPIGLISLETQILVDMLLNVEEASYQQITEQIGFKATSQRGRSIIASARRYLIREHHIHFDTVRTFGLKRTHGNEMLGVVGGRIKHISRHSQRSIRVAGCVEFEKLTPEEQAKFNAKVSIIGCIGTATRPKTVKQIENLAGKSKLGYVKTLRALLEAHNGDDQKGGQ